MSKTEKTMTQGTFMSRQLFAGLMDNLECVGTVVWVLVNFLLSGSLFTHRGRNSVDIICQQNRFYQSHTILQCFDYIFENKKIFLYERERHATRCVESPLGGTYLTWWVPTYLGWGGGYLPWLGRGYLPNLAGGAHLGWGGTYLGWGVPTLARVATMAKGTPGYCPPWVWMDTHLWRHYLPVFRWKCRGNKEGYFVL